MGILKQNEPRVSSLRRWIVTKRVSFSSSSDSRRALRSTASFILFSKSSRETTRALGRKSFENCEREIFKRETFGLDRDRRLLAPARGSSGDDGRVLCGFARARSP